MKNNRNANLIIGIVGTVDGIIDGLVGVGIFANNNRIGNG
jgi:hypothetical protein